MMVVFDPTKAGYSALSFSGISGRTTRILLDGQDITDETVGTTIFNVLKVRLARCRSTVARKMYRWISVRRVRYLRRRDLERTVCMVNSSITFRTSEPAQQRFTTSQIHFSVISSAVVSVDRSSKISCFSLPMLRRLKQEHLGSFYYWRHVCLDRCKISKHWIPLA